MLSFELGLLWPGVSSARCSKFQALKSRARRARFAPAAATTKVLIDFDVAQSFVLRGNSLAQNGLLFKPVIRGTLKS